MAIKVSAKVQGGKRLREALKKLSEAEKKAVRGVVANSGRRVRDDARTRSRKKSGKTAKSFKTKSISRGLGARIGSDYAPARFQEMGTKRQLPYPVLFPALEAEMNRFGADMREALNNAEAPAGAEAPDAGDAAA